MIPSRQLIDNPEMLRPGASIQRAHPILLARVACLLLDTGLPRRVGSPFLPGFWVTAAWRSTQHQAWLYREWLAGRYKVPAVAPPGTSHHEVETDRRPALWLPTGERYEWTGFFHAWDLVNRGTVPTAANWRALEAAANRWGLRLVVGVDDWAGCRADSKGRAFEPWHLELCPLWKPANLFDGLVYWNQRLLDLPAVQGSDAIARMEDFRRQLNLGSVGQPWGDVKRLDGRPLDICALDDTAYFLAA